MGIDPDDSRLQRLLGGPETSWILERVRTRLRRGLELRGTVTLTNASDEQRKAVARLLGRRITPGSSVSIPLERLDSILRESGACPGGLAAAVVRLTGPVPDPNVRQAEEAAWRVVDSELARLVELHPELADWTSGLRSRGQLKRVAASPRQATYLLRDIQAMAAALPADGEPIASFSARVLGRAHALDSGTPLGNLATAVAQAIGRSLKRAKGETYNNRERQTRAAQRRETWAGVGVLVDDLSSTVLALGLPGAAGRSGTAGALALLAAEGQPAVLTLRQTVVDDLGRVPAKVYVCENPAVVAAAADRFRSRVRPLVCIQGQPGAAAITLLKRLRAGGSRLYYHGDFDWGGVTIARTLRSRVDWLPWRFCAGDYLDGLDMSLEIESLPKLKGKKQDTPWNPQLASLMAERAVGLEEEVLLDVLLDDLVATYP